MAGERQGPTGWRRPGNPGAVCAHGRGGGCFGAGRALVPAARSITGVALILSVVRPEREAAAWVENVNDSPRKTDGDQGKLNEFPPSPATPPATADEGS
jgi:hypothetical protein